MAFSAAELQKVVDYYFEVFTQPLLRLPNQDVLEAHIQVACEVINTELGVDISKTSTNTFSNRLDRREYLFDVQEKPLVSIDEDSLLLNESRLDIADHPYKLHINSIEFYDGIGAGDFSFDYISGINVDDVESYKHGVCLEVNHLIEIKMLNAERVGIVTIKPDRQLIPVEVRAIFKVSDLDLRIV